MYVNFDRMKKSGFLAHAVYGIEAFTDSLLRAILLTSNADKGLDAVPQGVYLDFRGAAVVDCQEDRPEQHGAGDTQGNVGIAVARPFRIPGADILFHL